MEYVSNCITEAAQRVTTFYQHVAVSAGLWWVDQNNQTDERQQNSPAEVAIAILEEPSQRSRLAIFEVPSQRSGPPPPPPRPNAGSGGIDKQALLTEGKRVANWVASISASAICGFVPAVIGNEKVVLEHEYIFTAFMILSYASFVSALTLHLLIRKSLETRGFVKIVKFTIYFSQGTLVYCISCVVCLMFSSKFAVVFILVVPPVPFGLIAILSSARWGKGLIP